MKIWDWAKIENRFRDNLLLGNGASIAIDKRFSYRLLYEEVSNYSKLNKELLNLFKHYKTTNFKLILRSLLETHQVNKILGINDQKTMNYYLELRSALIETIRNIHPKYEEVKHHFTKVAQFLSRFKKVLSLNYDLLVYWAMLTYNETHGQWFKDCFVHGEFQKDREYLGRPYGTAKGATRIFYPHGTLFLATEPFGGEVKLSRSEKDYLLDSVLSKWERENYIPLFVSEGVSEEKLRAITRNSYLNTVLDSEVAKLSGSLVVYGWSFSNQDQHILDALSRRNLKEIAVSVYKKDKEWESFCDRIIDKIRRQPRFRLCRIDFFDAESTGCWIY